MTTPRIILSDGADMAERNGAPAEMVERLRGAAAESRADFVPHWASPAHAEKIETLPFIRDDEAD